jgi:hypothetical protein
MCLTFTRVKHYKHHVITSLAQHVLRQCVMWCDALALWCVAEWAARARDGVPNTHARAHVIITHPLARWLARSHAAKRSRSLP